VAAPVTPHIDIHRGGDRLKTRVSWLDSKHSFSFGANYDPENTHHGLLLVNNDDVVAPGAGFETHPHRDMEIVTWVLDGSLVHQDSLGHSGVVYPGLAQRMSAGSGILHSEKNDTSSLRASETAIAPAHFVQMWVVPDEGGLTPGYQQLEIDDELRSGDLVTVASGMAAHRNSTAITINSKHSALHVARMTGERAVTVPSAPFVHVFVAAGTIDMEGAGRLDAGDAVRLTNTGGQRIESDGPAEVLIWEMHARLGMPG
jgi:quercetin 2,3-dioxygenase